MDEDMMLILKSSDPQAMEFSVENLPVSLVQVGAYGSIVLAGSDYVVMEVLGRQFKVSASSFFQVNNLQAQAMIRHLTDHLPISSEMTVVDAYCGVGLFSAFLAPKVKRLVGIEVSPNACEDFSTNLDEFDQVELYEAPVEDVVLNVDFHADMIILDPPRAGLGAKTVAGIITQGAAHLAYVSCDPATLARDGKQLAEGDIHCPVSRCSICSPRPTTSRASACGRKSNKIKRGWHGSHPLREPLLSEI